MFLCKSRILKRDSVPPYAKLFIFKTIYNVVKKK